MILSHLTIIVFPLHSNQCLGLSLCFLTSQTISETFSVCLEGYSVGLVHRMSSQDSLVGNDSGKIPNLITE